MGSLAARPAVCSLLHFSFESPRLAVSQHPARGARRLLDARPKATAATACPARARSVITIPPLATHVYPTGAGPHVRYRHHWMRPVDRVRLIGSDGLAGRRGAARARGHHDRRAWRPGPEQRTSIHVRSQDLAIAIDPDGEHYDVSAKYLLRTPAARRHSVWRPAAFRRPTTPRRPDVRPMRSASRSVNRRAGARCSRRRSRSTRPLREPGDDTPGGWCTARLTFRTQTPFRCCSPTGLILCPGTNPARERVLRASGRACSGTSSFRPGVLGRAGRARLRHRRSRAIRGTGAGHLAPGSHEARRQADVDVHEHRPEEAAGPHG